MIRALAALWAWLTAPVEKLPLIDAQVLEEIIEPGRYQLGPYVIDYFGEVEYGEADVSLGEMLAPIARTAPYGEISLDGCPLYRYSLAGSFCEPKDGGWGPWQPGRPPLLE